MKTISMFIFAAAIVVIGAGGFIQIQSLNARMDRLEAASIKAEQALKKPQPGPTLGKKTETEVVIDRKFASTPIPEPQHIPREEKPTVSYLDKLLDLTP